MTRRKIPQSLSLIAVVTMAYFASAPASAGQCMFNMPFQSGSGCNTENTANSGITNVNPNMPSKSGSCVTGGTDKASRTSCASASNEELGNALVGVASGGMQIAGTVMRAIAGGANRLLGPDSDL